MSSEDPIKSVPDELFQRVTGKPERQLPDALFGSAPPANPAPAPAAKGPKGSKGEEPLRTVPDELFKQVTARPERQLPDALFGGPPPKAADRSTGDSAEPGDEEVAVSESAAPDAVRESGAGAESVAGQGSERDVESDTAEPGGVDADVESGVVGDSAESESDSVVAEAAAVPPGVVADVASGAVGDLAGAEPDSVAAVGDPAGAGSFSGAAAGNLAESELNSAAPVGSLAGAESGSVAAADDLAGAASGSVAAVGERAAVEPDLRTDVSELDGAEPDALSNTATGRESAPGASDGPESAATADGLGEAESDPIGAAKQTSDSEAGADVTSPASGASRALEGTGSVRPAIDTAADAVLTATAATLAAAESGPTVAAADDLARTEPGSAGPEPDDVGTANPVVVASAAGALAVAEKVEAPVVQGGSEVAVAAEAALAPVAEPRQKPVLLVIADSLAYFGPKGGLPADDPRIWPNLVAAELDWDVELIGRIGWTCRDGYWALIGDPRVWAAVPKASAVVFAVGGMDTLPSPLPTALRELIRYVRPPAMRRGVRAAYNWLQPKLSRLGRPVALPPKVSVGYLEQSREALAHLRPDLPFVAVLPSVHNCAAYGRVHSGRPRAVKALLAWSQRSGVPLVDLGEAVRDDIHSGEANPDGIHWGWAGHAAVAAAMTKTLREVG
ncbi:hypothetical protein DFR74_109164 [Nocardia puris]|uniref:GDSL-like lipase/acylhydrolase family protein n=1 Tax=Nocardia puris TaxID=208602 RepID=A0A366DEG6_9NOCA|nr:diglucosylglycerate octanoyltransferase [Nocardia puris]RBO88396.1 hypothetical protein DFR74_109164 [Nocardia puris]